MLDAEDNTTRLVSEPVDGMGSGGGGGSLGQVLSGETPPVVMQNLGDSGAASSPVPASTPTPSPVSVPAPVSGPSPFRSAVNSLLVPVGKASNALNEAGQKAATAAGVSPETAARIGSLVPWLISALLLGALGMGYALRHRIFHHKITA